MDELAMGKCVGHQLPTHESSMAKQLWSIPRTRVHVQTHAHHHVHAHLSMTCRDPTATHSHMHAVTHAHLPTCHDSCQRFVTVNVECVSAEPRQGGPGDSSTHNNTRKHNRTKHMHTVPCTRTHPRTYTPTHHMPPPTTHPPHQPCTFTMIPARAPSQWM